jgi:hypothetical protein
MINDEGIFISHQLNPLRVNKKFENAEKIWVFVKNNYTSEIIVKNRTGTDSEKIHSTFSSFDEVFLKEVCNKLDN